MFTPISSLLLKMTSLSTEFTDSLCEKFAADRSARTAQNAVTATSIVNVSLNREAIVRGKDFSCSVKLDDWSATNQVRKANRNAPTSSKTTVLFRFRNHLVDVGSLPLSISCDRAP